jgi:septal ring factor EnvC (AmiA/AmiB activator)
MEHTMNVSRNTLPRRSRLHAAFAAVLCGAALALAACATTPPPTEQIAVSNAALAHAVAAGGPELAPVEMATAREKMSRVNQAIAAKDYDTALALAQQAQLDAQLAEAKAESAKARKSAVALQEASGALREEMSRKAP